MESLVNSVIIAALYIEHWCDSINRRNDRLLLRNLNEQKFWRTPEARERRLNRRQLRMKSEKFFVKTWWYLDNFFNGYEVKHNFVEKSVKNSVRREIDTNKKFSAYLFALNKELRKEIREKYIRSMKAVRVERCKLIYDNDFVNWDEEGAQGLTGENIFNLTELFEGYPPYVPIDPVAIQCQRWHKKLELESMWGPLTKRDNVFNLRELFGEYDTELLIKEM